MADELPIVAGPRTEPAVTPSELPPVAPSVLDARQRKLLMAVLNRIVPPRGDLPGAGDLGVTDSIDRTLAASLTLRRPFFEGLVELELLSVRRHGRSFTDLDAETQEAVLRELEAARPAFFTSLVEHTYRGYYLLPQVHEAIGYQGRPPQPLGYELPRFDESLLDRQRQRAPFWRPTT